jgi:glutamyl-tRNA reductase
VNEIENVYVYDMDDLERVASENRELREQEVARAEEIVREELAALRRAERERTAVPILARLREHAHGVAAAELERTLVQLAPLDEKQKRAVRAMASAIVNKLLHGPTARLREEQGGPLASAAAELFGLEEVPGPEASDADEHADVLPRREGSDAEEHADVLPRREGSDAEEHADVLPI